VTGCLRPTPADNLPTLADIQPAELRRKGATLSLARRAMKHEHLLNSARTSSRNANARRLKSRHPFVPAAQLISSSDNNNRSEDFDKVFRYCKKYAEVKPLFDNRFSDFA